MHDKNTVISKLYAIRPHVIIYFPLNIDVCPYPYLHMLDSFRLINEYRINSVITIEHTKNGKNLMISLYIIVINIKR